MGTLRQECRLLAIMALAVGASSLGAQRSISRADYFAHVPEPPRISSQTAASLRFALFGDSNDPAHRDSLPRDGIDDARAARLHAIALRFAPILRRNNFSVPTRFTAVPGWKQLLQRDTWRDGVLVASDSFDLSPRSAAANSAADLSNDGAAVEDERLAALLRLYDPRASVASHVPAGPREHTTLYFDFPGSDEKSWRRAYQHTTNKDAHLYVHAFVEAGDSTAGAERFVFTLQFWMFYPFNDGPNNHEGDWEHINVSITTHERAGDTAGGIAGLLSEGDVARILQSDGTPIDSLTVRSVSYFFHHNVFTLDYLRPRLRHDLTSPGGTSAPIWEDAGFIAETITQRKTYAGGRLATHPIGYIGGNNRGIDEFLSLVPRFRGSYNRNSHGTYPFPGTWRSIGALGATERLFGAALPTLRRDLPNDSILAPNEIIDDRWFIAFGADQLTLLPDWERVIDLLGVDAAVRREWAFLILPIRWGFPASVSPGGGVVRRANLGNAAPLGLAYHAGWNRVDADEEHRHFDPHVLRVLMAPVTPLTALQDGWGVLNLPIALSQTVPGVNALISQLLPWISASLGVLGAPAPRTFAPGQLPARFTSFGAGRYLQFGGNEFGRLLPRAEDAAIQAFLLDHGAESARIDRYSFRRTANFGTRLWFTVHYGDHLAFENTFAADTTAVSYRITNDSSRTLATVRGVMAAGQASSGVKLNSPPLGDVLLLFARGGMSWSWYKVRNGALDGVPVYTTSKLVGHWPSLLPSTRWWPNSSYAGIGGEVFAPRSKWLAGAVGYGLRGEILVLLQPMRGSGCGCISRRQEANISLQLGW